MLEATPEQRKAEIAAHEAQRALEAIQAREREAQQRVAAEFERLEEEQRRLQEEEKAKLQMRKRQAEIVSGFVFVGFVMPLFFIIFISHLLQETNAK